MGGGTKKIEELLLAWVHTVLEHSSFSVFLRTFGLKKTLLLEISWKPNTVIRGLHNNRKHMKQRSTPTIGCANNFSMMG